jgi:hypothetical protein
MSSSFKLRGRRPWWRCSPTISTTSHTIRGSLPALYEVAVLKAFSTTSRTDLRPRDSARDLAAQESFGADRRSLVSWWLRTTSPDRYSFIKDSMFQRMSRYALSGKTLSDFSPWLERLSKPHCCRRISLCAPKNCASTCCLLRRYRRYAHGRVEDHRQKTKEKAR